MSATKVGELYPRDISNVICQVSWVFFDAAPKAGRSPIARLPLISRPIRKGSRMGSFPLCRYRKSLRDMDSFAPRMKPGREKVAAAGLHVLQWHEMLVSGCCDQKAEKFPNMDRLGRQLGRTAVRPVSRADVLGIMVTTYFSKLGLAALANTLFCGESVPRRRHLPLWVLLELQVAGPLGRTRELLCKRRHSVFKCCEGLKPINQVHLPPGEG